MSDLCDFEKDVIRLIAGIPQDTIKGWGAGLGAALGPLVHSGHLARSIEGGAIKYSATDKGIAPVQEEQSDE